MEKMAKKFGLSVNDPKKLAEEQDRKAYELMEEASKKKVSAGNPYSSPMFKAAMGAYNDQQAKAVFPKIYGQPGPSAMEMKERNKEKQKKFELDLMRAEVKK